MLKRLTISVCALGATLAVAAPAFAQAQPKATTGTAKEFVATTGSDQNTDGSDNTCRIQKHPCLTIQHAIDIAPNTATISVAAGKYPESLVIDDKDLTIKGSTSKTAPTVIDPDASTLPFLHDDPLAPSSPIASIVLFHNTNSGGLTNVTVDGGQGGAVNATSCNDDFVGVFFEGATGSLKNSTVTNIVLPPGFTGCQQGFAVYAADDTSDLHTVTMSADKVSNYNKDGILCDGAGTSCAISGSTVTGDGPNGTIAQNGVELDDLDNAGLTTTKVTNNTYTNPQFPTGGATSASGVLMFDDAQANASGNTLTSNDVGLFAENDNGIGSGALSITGNKITGSTNVTASGANPVPDNDGIGDGLQLFNADTATVTGNTISGGAGAGISLFGITNSQIGDTGKGEANTISSNGYDGIVMGSGSGPSTGNMVAHNNISANQRDGIEVLPADDNGQQATGNTFSANKLTKNLRFDAEDQSTGTGTGGTANTWGGQVCAPALDSSPAALCSAPAVG